MEWIVLGALAALVIWQVFRGVAIGGNWRPWYRRSAQPGQFWTVIAVQSAMILAVAVLWSSLR